MEEGKIMVEEGWGEEDAQAEDGLPGEDCFGGSVALTSRLFESGGRMEEEKSWRRNGGQEMLKEDGLPAPNCCEVMVALTTDFPALAGVVENGGGEKQRRNGGVGRRRCARGRWASRRRTASEELVVLTRLRVLKRMRKEEEERGREQRSEGRRYPSEGGGTSQPGVSSSRSRAVRPSGRRWITKGVTIKVAGARLGTAAGGSGRKKSFQ
jgi:hypothetical protein